MAGIDQALWDIKGKALGVPVHELLGGQVRDKIRVYSWIGGDRPADTARAAKEAVERGFTAVKMNGTEEMHFVDTYDKVDLVLENVAGGARCGRAERRHRRRFPRPRAQADGQGADEGTGAVQADVHRGAGAQRTTTKR